MIFKFLKGFTFPFLEDFIVFLLNCGYFMGGSFRLEFPDVEGFGFVVGGGITDGKDGLFVIRLVFGSLNDFVYKKVKHLRDKYAIIFICEINLIT